MSHTKLNERAARRLFSQMKDYFIFNSLPGKILFKFKFKFQQFTINIVLSVLIVENSSCLQPGYRYGDKLDFLA